jgi:hypothetical protein
MADFNLIVSLFTPGSDLATGDPNAEFEAVFARAGNDVIYAYDPGANNNEKRNIDFLFGDIFDNSQAEYEIIVNIQNTQQGGNPLLILDRNIPSIGADRFVLGDENRPYYTDNSGLSDSLIKKNFLGLNEFAVIYDFSPAQDTIQLNGKPGDYRIVEINGLKVEGIAQPFSGEAIFSLQQGKPDLVAYVISKPEVDLNLNDKYFKFVGNKPQTKPSIKKVSQLGTTGIDFSLAAATDSSGNVYITGSTSGALEGTNKGSTDVWVAKYDNKGKQSWLKQIGSAGAESAYAVVTDSQGNFYLAGLTGGDLFSPKESETQDAWVAKYDSSGNVLWSKQIGVKSTGGYANSAFGLDVDKAGNVYISGLAIKENTRRDIFNFNVQDDSWVTKLDSNGNQQWFREVGSFFFDECYDVAVDNAGNSYLTGWTQGLVKESDPSRQLSKYDAWLTKVNPTGEVQWTQQFGSKNEGLDFAWAVDTDSKGNIYTTGWTTGELGIKDQKSSKSESYDIWLTKFSPDGTQQWAKQFGSKGDDGTFLSDMEIDSKDNIFLTGYTNDKLGKGTKDSSYNAWVAKFDTEGSNKWIQQFGSKSNLDYPTGLSVDSSDKLYVTGFTEGFLGSSSTGANGAGVDGWLAELDANKGNLKKFTGNAKNVISVQNPSAIPVTDVSTELVTDEKLPTGDNRINPAAGISINSTSTNSTLARSASTNTTLNYGQIVSGLAGAFDSNVKNSFNTVLSEGVASGNAPFLNSNDLNFLQA